MRLGSLRALFEKIERYLGRRTAHRDLSFKTTTRTRLTPEQLEVIAPGDAAAIARFLQSRIGSREGMQVLDIRTIGDPLSHAEIEDLAEDLAKALWDCKDRIFGAAKKQGIDDARVWAEIEKHRELCLVADLANTIKHGGLSSRPKSGIRPVINGVHTASNVAEQGPIYLDGDQLVMELQNASFEVYASLRDLDNQTNEFAEVFHVCELALTQWREVITELGLPVE